MKICSAIENRIGLRLKHRPVEMGCQKNSKCAFQFKMFSFTQLLDLLGLLKLSNIYLGIQSEVQVLPCTKNSFPQEPAENVR